MSLKMHIWPIVLENWVLKNIILKEKIKECGIMTLALYFQLRSYLLQLEIPEGSGPVSSGLLLVRILIILSL